MKINKEMKELDKIKSKLKEKRNFLKEKYYVEKIGIFGSVSKGTDSPDSDVDVLVEFNGPIGWDIIELKEYLEAIIGREVDLVSIKALKTQLKLEILSEVIYV